MKNLYKNESGASYLLIIFAVILIIGLGFTMNVFLDLADFFEPFYFYTGTPLAGQTSADMDNVHYAMGAVISNMAIIIMIMIVIWLVVKMQKKQQ